MDKITFDQRLNTLMAEYESLIGSSNVKQSKSNGIYDRYEYPVLTDAHTPLFWRYDLDCNTNPHLMERMGINAVFNTGAMYHDGKFFLFPRIEGWDRKSFFGIAESPNGIDNFRFWDYPITIPETDDPATNVYDMRVVKHEDGWIYGVFCAERKDPNAPEGDLSSAVAQCGIVRTKDLKTWERLPDLQTPSPQQRNCVLHPEFIDGQYAFYTRPQDDFIMAGRGGGIGWGLCADITNPVIKEEKIVDERAYHTIKELKNGQGPAPIKTDKGWLHIAHGVRACAAGLRYVLYMFMTDLNQPEKVTYQPGGYFMAPQGEERIGDVSNVLFVNGWAVKGNDVFIYYGSSDTRTHIATSTIDQLVDYVTNTPPDGMTSSKCVEQRTSLIEKNLKILKR